MEMQRLVYHDQACKSFCGTSPCTSSSREWIPRLQGIRPAVSVGSSVLDTPCLRTHYRIWYTCGACASTMSAEAGDRLVLGLNEANTVPQALTVDAEAHAIEVGCQTK